MSIAQSDIEQNEAALLWNIRKGLWKLEEKDLDTFYDNLKKNLTENEVKALISDPPSGKYRPHDVSCEVDSNKSLLEGIARTLKALPETKRSKIVEGLKLEPGQARSLNTKIVNVSPKAEPDAPELPPLPELPKGVTDKMLFDVIRGIVPGGGVPPVLWFEPGPRFPMKAPPPPVELPVETPPKTDPLIPGEQTSNAPRFLGKRSVIRS